MIRNVLSIVGLVVGLAALATSYAVYSATEKKHQEVMDWSELISNNMNEAREVSRLSRVRMTEQLGERLTIRMEERDRAVADGMGELLSLVEVKQEEFSKRQVELEKDLERQREGLREALPAPAANGGQPEVPTVDLEKYIDTDPRRIVENSDERDELLRYAGEVMRRHGLNRARADSLRQQIRSLEAEEAELRGIQPQPPHIKGRIEEIKAEVAEKKRELKKVERRIEKEKRVIRYLKTLLKLAAVFALASGNYTAAAALWAAASMLDGADGSGGGDGGGGDGGDGGGDGGDGAGGGVPSIGGGGNGNGSGGNAGSAGTDTGQAFVEKAVSIEEMRAARASAEPPVIEKPVVEKPVVEKPVIVDTERGQAGMTSARTRKPSGSPGGTVEVRYYLNSPHVVEYKQDGQQEWAELVTLPDGMAFEKLRDAKSLEYILIEEKAMTIVTEGEENYEWNPETNAWELRT